jgi:D-3-phosphoglycerate dehydrogenase
MANKTVVVLDPYHKDAIAMLLSTPELDVVLPDDPRKSQWREIADGVILRSNTRLTAEDFSTASASKKLQVVVKQGVGVDNIDLEGAKAAGIAVHNTPALNSESVAELTLALGMSLSRRVAEIDRRIRAGEKVDRTKTLAVSLFKKTVGIVGMGNIGVETAKKWIGACDATIIGYDPVAKDDIWPGIPHTRVKNLDDLVRQSDVVTLHVPLLPTTKGMIGAPQLALMKDNAILINAARGGLVDEKALLDALKEKRIWGAALDAMETEPPTVEAYKDFFELHNVIMTPHVGASTMENQSRSGTAVVEILLEILNGGKDVRGKVV